MMKIWNIVSGNNSGALNIAVTVGAFLQQCGHNVELVFRKYNKTNIKNVAVIKDYCTIDYIKHLSSEIRKGKPDLILVHGYSTHIWTKLALMLSGEKIRLIHVEHNVESYTNLRRWLTAKLDLYTEKYICVSNGVAENLKKQGVDADKIRVVYNGIDIQSFEKIPVVPHEKFVIGMVARFSKQKDQMTLIRAIEYLVKERNQKNIELILLGQGKTRNMCQQYVQKHELESWITFKEGSIKALIPQIDLFVLATHYEGLPLVLCEAMAAKIPIVATNVAGVDEIVLDRQTGWLVPENDFAAMADAILFCHDNQGSPEMQEIIKKMGIEVNLNFSLDKMCKQYQKMIEG